MTPSDPQPERFRVAVIGAGPIGIELAIALKKGGIDYVQLDAAQIGATIAWYPQEMLFHSSADRLSLAGVPLQVPDQQKPKREEYLAYLRSLVMQFDLKIRSYERVEEARRLDDGTFELRTRALTGARRYVVENVILAVGAMSLPRMMGIPGEELPQVSHYFHDPHTYFGKRLLIVGGKNSAVEAAVRLQRAGAIVTIAYRRADFDPAIVKFWLLPEVRGMIRDGRVRLLPSLSPVEIRRDAVVLQRCDAEGRPLPDGEPRIVETDFVLLMTGYTQETMLFRMLGVAQNPENGQPMFDPDTMETNVPGVYLAGTAVAGPSRRRGLVIVETCHEHSPRIVAALSGDREARQPLPAPLDENL